jgi:DNA-binding FadR family transcriptional regulator
MIEADITSRHLPAGHFLGTESQLITQYEASRPVLRTVVGLLEQVGLAEMKRGQHGGLIVTEPAASSVAHAMAIHLEYRQTTKDEMFAARELLEVRCALQAAELGISASLEKLQEVVAAGRTHLDTGNLEAHWSAATDFHRVLGQASGNRAYALFLAALSELTASYGSREEYEARLFEENQRSHEKILKAILAGDGGEAANGMRVHVRAIATSAGCGSVDLDHNDRAASH